MLKDFMGKMMRKITAIIPTLLKDRGVLDALIMSLVSDSAVEEIIVINNSSEDYAFDNSKVRIISEGKNLFVNPSWNLGVREVKTEYVTLVNDDIKIPDSFCSKVLEKFDDKYGILGINSEDVVNTRNEKNEVVVDINSVELQASGEISFKPVKYRPPNFGIMMFFKKENYSEIPDELKIFFGDDWLLYSAHKKGKVNAVICGDKVYHMGSLSSNLFADVGKQENKYYWKFIVPKYKRIFSIVDTYLHHNIFILGLKIAIKKQDNSIMSCDDNLIKTPQCTLLQKIFSIKNECSNGKKYKIIHLLGIKISIKITEEKKFLKLQKNFIKLEKSLKNKEIIKIAFMVSLASMFPAKPFLDYLLSKSNRYKVKILIVPDFRFGIENTHKFQEECYKELSKEYNQDIIIKSPIDKRLDNIDISKIADILFCSLPYDVSHKKYSLKNLVKDNILLAMVNYGVYILPKFAKESLSHPRLGYFKYLFYESPYIFNMFQRYSITKGVNGILSGYCKMDKYKNCPDKNKHKTVILAPHHSVLEGFNDILELSNFYKYANFFLKLPEIYPNIDWIFRPHPALFPLLEQDKFWGKEKVKKYLNKMCSYSNVEYSTKGDYFYDFAKSDGIIQDCESFLFEYFYTGKPQCYMLKDNIDNKEKFGEFGSKLLEHCYTTYSEQDILNFINTVILQEQDIKKEARNNFARKEVMINYPNVSKFIFNYFEK